MKIYFSVLAFSALLLAGCGKSDSTPATTGGGNANNSADYAGALARSQNKAVNTVDLASLNQAVQLFNVQEGRYPKDLNELVQSKLISKVPDAPRGMKLAYDSTTGKVTTVPE